MGVYEIRFAMGVEKDLKKLPTYHRRIVIHAIETQLLAEPTTPTRNRKMLASLIAPWTAEQPIWELRVGNFRVFYDVSDEEPIVYGRAVWKEATGRTTEDIL